MRMTEEITFAPLNLVVPERINRDLEPFDPFVKRYRFVFTFGHSPFAFVRRFSFLPLFRLDVTCHEGRERVRHERRRGRK